MLTQTRTIPESGTFTIAAWAETLDMPEATVLDYVQRYAIPTDGETIDARQWWRAIATNTPKPPRTAILFEVIDMDGQTLFGPVDRSTAKGYRDGRKELGRRCKLVRRTWTCSE